MRLIKALLPYYLLSLLVILEQFAKQRVPYKKGAFIA